MSARPSLEGRLSRRRPDTVLLVLLGTVPVTAAVCLVMTLAAPGDAQAYVAWCTAVAAVFVCVGFAGAAHNLQRVRRLHVQLSVRRAASVAAADRLVNKAMPDLLQRLRDGAPIETAMAAAQGISDESQRRVLRTLAEELSRVERTRAAAMAACANAAGRVQALTTSMLADLRDMENKYGEDVLADLLHLDHSTAQAGRLADSIAVLTGARSGRRWTKPIVMESILRGAVGRISAYQRVQLHSTVRSAIAGYAAEGVIHALAELIDNAAQFSSPSEQVHVYVEDVQAGLVVTVEDGGVGMRDRALAKAQQAVSAGTLDLTTLSGTRLGLAVVGCLARKYGLTVSFRPSSRGGTGVVVMIPRQLITEVSQDNFPAPAGDSAVVSASTSVAAPRGSQPHTTADAAPRTIAEPADLPQRKRGQTLAAMTAAKTAKPAEPTKPRPMDPGTAFGAFHRAIHGNRPATAEDDESR